MGSKPNVIFILADDMGYGDFSTFNEELTNTKAVDSLVKDGMTLCNCYSSSPVCAPARASIMTGRYPQRTGVIDTLEVRGYDRLKLSETTIADIFKQNGYFTGLIGKWHLGAIDPEYHPNRRGFDYFLGFRGGWNDYYDYQIERNGEKLPCDGTYLTDVFSKDAVRFVREHKDEPFFLHLAYNAPHFPLQATDSVVQKYRDLKKYTEGVCKVYAMIEIMDKGIQRVLDEINICGIQENTIIIFTSDNGPDFGGEGDNSTNRFNCGLKGHKMLVYEGGIKIPAVVRWSGVIPASKKTTSIIHGTDWLPTLMCLCGLTYPNELSLDGIDVSGSLKGNKFEERMLYWQWNRYQPDKNCNAAVLDGKWKLVHAPIDEYLDLPSWEIDMDVEIKYHPERFKEVSKKEIPQRDVILAPVIELYDLKNDPEEKTNIAGQEMKICQNLERKYESWFKKVEKDRLS